MVAIAKSAQRTNETTEQRSEKPHIDCLRQHLCDS
ncbi:MAG: hypothetical protein ACI89X_005022 [Planctomycetota bacterium]|jgi:hypothetical protein